MTKWEYKMSSLAVTERDPGSFEPIARTPARVWREQLLNSAKSLRNHVKSMRDHVPLSDAEARDTSGAILADLDSLTLDLARAFNSDEPPSMEPVPLQHHFIEPRPRTGEEWNTWKASIGQTVQSLRACAL
jgi:hypothetical protein